MLGRSVQHESTATGLDTGGLAGTPWDGDLHRCTTVDVVPLYGMQEARGSNPHSSTFSQFRGHLEVSVFGLWSLAGLQETYIGEMAEPSVLAGQRAVRCRSDMGTPGRPRLEASRAASRLIRVLPTMAAGRLDAAAHRRFHRAE